MDSDLIGRTVSAVVGVAMILFRTKFVDQTIRFQNRLWVIYDDSDRPRLKFMTVLVGIVFIVLAVFP